MSRLPGEKDDGENYPSRQSNSCGHSVKWRTHNKHFILKPFLSCTLMLYKELAHNNKRAKQLWIAYLGLFKTILLVSIW